MPKAKPLIAKSKSLSKAIRVVGWITGVLVALAVGFGMADGTLKVPLVQPLVPLAGWIVVILTLIGVVMALIDKFR